MSTSYESRSAGVLRIGDAERVAAASALGDHFAAGRIDQEELDQRLSAAYAARTFADLDPLFEDLPAPRPTRPVVAAPEPAPRGISRSKPARGPTWWGAWTVPAVPLPLLLLGFLAVISIVGTLVFFAPFILIPLFWMWCVGAGRCWRGYGRRDYRWR